MDEEETRNKKKKEFFSFERSTKPPFSFGTRQRLWCPILKTRLDSRN